MPFSMIRRYLSYLDPVLHRWADRVTGLREITADDIREALNERSGHSARNRHTGLRSLFRALKQERLIFRDPTRGISVPKVNTLPAPIPSDQLRGLIERTSGSMAQLVVALIAIHGLGVAEVTRLHVADLDLTRGRLTVRRDTWPHTVYLDELTHARAVAWLRERRRRWPVTTNPHLLISQVTSADTTDQAVSTTLIKQIFKPLNISPSSVRQDRILHEARETADPVHLMRVFGIVDATAMRYVYAAHPERRSVPTR